MNTGGIARPTWGKSPWVAGLLLFAVALFVYIPALSGGFVWDDRSILTENPLMLSPSGLAGIWFGGDTHDYFPFTLTSLWVDRRLWGPANAMGFHAVNIVLHAVSSILLWRVLLRLEIPGAWLAAVLFAVHPINVPSVAWIAERKNTLSIFFFLASALWYFRFEASRGAVKYCLALFLFVLALLSKTSTVMLPCVLLLCAWWQRSRISVRDLKWTAPFFLLSLVMGMVTIWFQNHRAIAGAEVPMGDFMSRVLTAGWAAAFYLGSILWPGRLSMLYPHWKIDHASMGYLLPALALVGLLLLGIMFRKSWGRRLLFALGYFLITLFPVLGFFRMYYFRLSPVADHWVYISSIGILALAASGLTLVARRIPIVNFVVVGLVALLAWQSWERSKILHNESTLWSDVLRKDPDSWTANTNLAIVAVQQGEVGLALEHGKRLVELEPDYVESHLNYGSVLAKAGRQREAVAAYRAAVKLAPASPDVVRELALALRNNGELAEALDTYRTVAGLNPESAQSFTDLGDLFYQMQRPAEAVECFRQVVAREPLSADARNNLAGALYLIGDKTAAVEQYREALRIDPGHAAAQSNLQGVLGLH